MYIQHLFLITQPINLSILILAVTTLCLDGCFTLSRLEVGQVFWHIFNMFTFKGVLHLNFSSVRMKWCFHGSQSEYEKNDSERHSLIFNLLPGKLLLKFIQLCVRYCGGAFLVSEIKLFMDSCLILQSRHSNWLKYYFTLQLISILRGRSRILRKGGHKIFSRIHFHYGVFW